MIRPENMTSAHRFDQFDCGTASLNDWLQLRAWRSHITGASEVRVIARDGAVVGYHALSPAMVVCGEAAVPVVLLGRFAVDRRAQRQGVGEALFRDALTRSLYAVEMNGARAVVIRTLNAAAAAYYTQQGFVATAHDALTLYQSLTRIEAQLAQSHEALVSQV